MKRIVMMMLSVALTLPMMAQTEGIGIDLGFAGPVFRATDGIPGEPGKVFYKGLKVGLVYDATFVKGFGCQVGLNYTFGADLGKWESMNDFSTWPKMRQEYYIHSLELPLDLQYKFEVAEDTYIIVYTGPTVQCHLSAPMNLYTKDRPSADTESYKADLIDEEYGYRRANVLWGVGVGFQYHRYFIRGGYDFGLMNAYRNDTYASAQDVYNVKSRFDQWQIKLGVYLWAPKK